MASDTPPYNDTLCVVKLTRRYFKVCAHVAVLVGVSYLINHLGVEDASTKCLLKVAADTATLGHVSSATMTSCHLADLNFTK